MRIRIALALALCAAAAPLHAQPGSAYHGPGYDLMLPARYEFMTSLNTVQNGQPMTLYLFGSDAGGLMVIRANLPATLSDTSMATRRAMLQLVRAGMLQARGDVRLEGEPLEIVKDDRITLRTPITMVQQGESLRGTADVSVSRRGSPSVWVLIAFQREAGDYDENVAKRALDSFRVTGEDASALPPEEPARTGGKDLSAKP